MLMERFGGLKNQVIQLMLNGQLLNECGLICEVVNCILEYNLYENGYSLVSQ